jgi:predicted phosphodiesterase
MTNLAILSDIHGNIPALEAVLTDLAAFEIDHVIVPGDVIGFGPSPIRATQIVIEKGWSVIRGNNEFFLTDYKTARAPAEWEDPVQFAPTAWLDHQFDHRLKTIIGSWPDTLSLFFRDAPPILVCHGTPASPWETIYSTMTDDEIEKTLLDVKPDYVICGHTHLPMDRQSGKWRIFNPGSVGVPLDGLFSASYMLLEGNEKGWTPTFRRVPFDYEALFAEFERSGYTRESGPMGRLILEVYRTARPLFGFLRWRETQKRDFPITYELVEEYLTNCNWWEYSHPAYHINIA